MSPCHRYLLTYYGSRMVFEPVIGDLGVYLKKKGLAKTLWLCKKQKTTKLTQAVLKRVHRLCLKPGGRTLNLDERTVLRTGVGVHRLKT